jgi:hypothetical protein
MVSRPQTTVSGILMVVTICGAFLGAARFLMGKLEGLAIADATFQEILLILLCVLGVRISAPRIGYGFATGFFSCALIHFGLFRSRGCFDPLPLHTEVISCAFRALLEWLDVPLGLDRMASIANILGAIVSGVAGGLYSIWLAPPKINDAAA